TGADTLPAAKDVQQDAEHDVLGPGVALGRQPAVTGLERVRRRAVVDVEQSREKHVGAPAGNGAPARRPALLHGHGVTADPEEMPRDVAQQPVALAIGACLQTLHDLRLRTGFVLEVASDDRLELLQSVEDREVQLGEEIEWERDATVAIEHERLHDAHLRGVSGLPRLSARARRHKTGKCFPADVEGTFAARAGARPRRPPCEDARRLPQWSERHTREANPPCVTTGAP